jgi:chromosomal replication initiator protein
MGMIPSRVLRIAAPRLTPINRIASVHVAPIELGPITCDDYLVAHWIIDDWIRRSEFAPAPSTRLIKCVVAEAFQIPVSNMESERRTNEVVFPRMIAMYLAKALRPDSYPKIGRAFGGRNHTTILHAVRKIERMMSCDPEFFARIECLKSRIGARG